MLVATREDRVHHDVLPFGPAEPPRSLMSRFTGSVQVVGSVVGIPLALLGGYSTYHSNFSPEAKCQSLRTSIVSMLDKKTDATTLRMLVQRDVVTFQRDCGEVDPDAVAAFKNLLTVERAQAATRPAAPAPKVEAAAPVKAEPPKAEPAPKVEAAKPEPAKSEAAKVEAPKKQQPAPVMKREAEKPIQEAKPQIRSEPKSEPKSELKSAERPVEKPAEKPAEMTVAKPEVAQPEPKAAEAPAPGPVESVHADSAWIASVRDALRESAARPAAAEPVPEMANPMPPPINISGPPAPRREASPRVEANAPPRPPADLTAPPEPRQEARPVPPAAIPSADTEAPPPAEN